MEDADLRGALLKIFYGLRHNNDGWVPTSEVNVSNMANVTRGAIGGVCQQLSDAGLIAWRSLGENSGATIGSAKITAAGVDVVTGSRSPRIEVRFPDAVQRHEPQLDGRALEFAEKAVFGAFAQLVEKGQRAYSQTVPGRASEIIFRQGKGVLSRAHAMEHANIAITGLARRSEIEIHAEHRKDWKILKILPLEEEDMSEPSRRIFIVHGHDEAAKQTSARYLEGIGFMPIILHEQVSRSRTVIEKIEAYSDVGFAIVLLTPDDFGGKTGDEAAPRMRQNVIFELGYFIGKLGRHKVCALLKDSMEIPSDFAGVIYQSIDDGGAWKIALARELNDAGYEIDWQKVGAA